MERLLGNRTCFLLVEVKITFAELGKGCMFTERRWLSVGARWCIRMHILVFNEQAGWTWTHTNHKDTEQSTIEVSFTLDFVRRTDALIR
jgi:hypothetical protein